MLPVLLNPPEAAKAGVAEVASKPMTAMDKITSVLANCEFLRIMQISFFGITMAYGDRRFGESVFHERTPIGCGFVLLHMFSIQPPQPKSVSLLNEASVGQM
jgi:hypothetical protein